MVYFQDHVVVRTHTFLDACEEYLQVSGRNVAHAEVHRLSGVVEGAGHVLAVHAGSDHRARRRSRC